VHKSLDAAVIKTVHKGGRVQLVMIRGARGKRLVFGSLYAPTEGHSEEVKQNFWSDVTAALTEIGLRNRDALMLPGDFNGETGRQVRDNADEDDVDVLEPAVGQWGVGEPNDNGQRLVEMCEQNGWFVANSLINRPPRSRWTFRGVFGVSAETGKRQRREYDHFLCGANLRGRVSDVRNRWDTKHESDHCLRIMVVNMRAQGLLPVKRVKNPTTALRLKRVAMDLNRRLASRMGPDRWLPGLREGEFPVDGGVQELAEWELPDGVDIRATWDELKKHVHNCGQDAVPEDQEPAAHSGITEGTM
jgi:hypothetical protein